MQDAERDKCALRI